MEMVNQAEEKDNVKGSFVPQGFAHASCSVWGPSSPLPSLLHSYFAFNIQLRSPLLQVLLVLLAWNHGPLHAPIDLGWK